MDSNAKSRLNEHALATLVDEFDRHGARLVPHLVDEAQREFRVTRDALRKRLDRHFRRVETGWSLQRDFDFRWLEHIAYAPDALDAYQRLRRVGVAPPTYRLFRRVFIGARGYPELKGVRDRDRAVMKLAARGQGRRACAECASWTRRQVE